MRFFNVFLFTFKYITSPPYQYLLEEGHSRIVGRSRICGALQNIRKEHIAEDIK